MNPEHYAGDERRSEYQTIVATRTNMTPYVIASVVIFGVAILAIVALTIARPEADNTGLIATVLGLATTTAASVASFMKAQETHLSVNGRLDAFMRNAQMAASAKGFEAGRASGRADANMRTDELATAQRTEDMTKRAETMAATAPPPSQGDVIGVIREK